MTSYGSATGSCNIPLVSDWLKTEGRNNGASFVANFNKTEYNVSTSSAYDKVTATGLNAAFVCGARVVHTAYKSGVQWYNVSTSGCDS